MALSVAAVTVLAACATDSRVAVELPVTVRWNGPAGPPAVRRRRWWVSVGARSTSRPSTPRPTPGPTTACDGTHGTETFWVGEMDPAIDAWPGSDDQALAVLDRQVDQECTNRHLDYLGFDPVASANLPPDRLQVFAFYMPT